MSRRKLALQIIGIILIAACGYTGGILAERGLVDRERMRMMGSTPDAWSQLPKVDGEIVACLPSPDYSRIAIRYLRQSPLCPVHSIVIFDAQKRKLLGEAHPLAGAPSASWTWSPDSMWLTIPEEENHLRMLSRDGQERIIQTGRSVQDIIWRENQPHTFLYTSSQLYEYNLDTRTERLIKIAGVESSGWLFTMNGKPCVTGGAAGGSPRHIAAYLVDTGQRVLEIASPPQEEYSSVSSIETSPDGKFVSLVCCNGTKELGLIARRKDLDSVLGDRSKALYLEERTDPYFRVVWPTACTDSSAIVEGRAIDLSDGCLRYSRQDAKRLAHWKPLTANGKRIPCSLEVGRLGLCMRVDDQSISVTPILGHTVSTIGH